MSTSEGPKKNAESLKSPQMVEQELECPGCRHKAVYRFIPGRDPLCKGCGAEIDLTPGVQAHSSQGRVKGGKFSPKLQKFVKTKVSDLDDDPTDDHFLTPEVKVVPGKGVKKVPKPPPAGPAPQ